MKKHLRLLTVLLVLIATGVSAFAAEWSYNWPNSATSADERNNGYPGGYYNFSSSADPTLTTLTRTFNGITWTARFDAGCILAYTSSGQTIGQKGKALTEVFTMTSDSFAGKIKSVTVSARVDNAQGTVAVDCNGTPFLCGDAEAASITSAKDLISNTFTAPGDGIEGTLTITLKNPSPVAPVYLKEIKVVYEEGTSTVAVPSIAPVAGSYDEPFEVTISAADGAEIFYTTDGSSPRNEGIPYTAPFTVGKSCTVKAIARQGEDFSAVVEAKYIIRVSPELSFTKDALTIELLEEDLALIDNPHRVEPVTYSSSNSAIAYCDKYGHIYTYGLGKCTITASFAGDENYLPQSISLPIEVVAKEPLAGLVVTPAGGDYKDAVDVKVSCDDPRAVTIWYHIGDEPMTLDELGLLDEFDINPTTTLSLTLDHSCVLSVQAIGENVWSEPQFISYNIEMPLRADFSGPEALSRIYYNGFDSEDAANEWLTSSGSSWQLTPTTGFSGVPDFTSINPESKYSLFHRYANTGDASVVVSPDMTLPANAQVRFYSVFNPVWIIYGNLELYICETSEGAQPEKIWDAFLSSQEAATDDIKWTRYSADLSKYAGKEVYFSFVYYLTDGDNILIDDFEVLAPEGDGSVVTALVGEALSFTSKCTGAPESYLWSFPGADTEESTEANPTVTYSAAGTYSVSLTVKRGDETATATRENYVVVKAQAPTAAIEVGAGAYFSPEASLVVPVGRPVTFIDASKGNPTTSSWTHPGAEVLELTDKSITVVYLSEGMYDVDLEVRNEAGTSATYITGVKAGGESLIWNIAAEENADLSAIDFSWYGYYGGTNWLDMDAFAEAFEAPAAPASISAVNVYFAAATTVTPDAPIKVAIALKDENGMPGEEIASATLKASELVDASQTYNDPTEFVFDTPVKVSEAFFVTISGFPNNDTEAGIDDIAMYALRRPADARNTAYHLLKEYDDYYQPTGETNWYAQTEDPTSFAIAPKIEFDKDVDSIDEVSTATQASDWIYYNIQGIRVDASKLTPGLYIRVSGSVSEKVVLR